MLNLAFFFKRTQFSTEVFPSTPNFKFDPTSYSLNEFTTSSDYSSYLSNQLEFTEASKNCNKLYSANPKPKFKSETADRVKRIKWTNNSIGKNLNNLEAWLYSNQNK